MSMMLEVPSLAALPGVRHAIFTPRGGVSTGVNASLNAGIGSHDDPAAVAENRARMAAALRVSPPRLLTAYQVHSATVIVAEEPWSAEARPRGDAIVTRVPELAIGASTADCAPVLFADPEARVIGAAHAGWRGALAGVIEATIAAMERLGARRSRILAALGPMIRQANYEVGADLIDQFLAANPANACFFAAGRPGHAGFDLAGYIAARLARHGVERIEDLGSCTYGDPVRFFSFRRATHRGEADYGRHISAIALR
jgi:YfiH family protein